MEPSLDICRMYLAAGAQFRSGLGYWSSQVPHIDFESWPEPESVALSAVSQPAGDRGCCESVTLSRQLVVWQRAGRGYHAFGELGLRRVPVVEQVESYTEDSRLLMKVACVRM